MIAVTIGTRHILGRTLALLFGPTLRLCVCVCVCVFVFFCELPGAFLTVVGNAAVTGDFEFTTRNVSTAAATTTTKPVVAAVIVLCSDLPACVCVRVRHVCSARQILGKRDTHTRHAIHALLDMYRSCDVSYETRSSFVVAGIVLGFGGACCLALFFVVFHKSPKTLSFCALHRLQNLQISLSTRRMTLLMVRRRRVSDRH